MRKIKALGLAASLRNARTGEGAAALARELADLADEKALKAYLAAQGNIHLDQYFQAGRSQGVPYDVMYAELRRMGGRRGLSNSEICLAAALWGAAGAGADIDLVALGDHFLPDGTCRDLETLRRKVLESDAILVGTPVYFGDRSSLGQRFISMLQADPTLAERARSQVYGGVVAGAKRNGGQETTLIYQLHDMMGIGFVGVGNDFSSTSQYGGTGHAGDVGAMAKDDIGLDTCVGTGRRAASVAAYLRAAEDHRLRDRPRAGLLILQDRDRQLASLLRPFLDRLADRVEFVEIDLADENILPCLGCDICPSRVGPDEEFRCIRGGDVMRRLHETLLGLQAIIPAVLAPGRRAGLSSSYQQFLERTRYLRRGDYGLAEKLIAPLVIGEVGVNDNFNLRMCSSFIRHHTSLCAPIQGWLHQGVLLNPEDVAAGLERAGALSAALYAGRLAMISQGAPLALYKPIGFVLSLAKDNLPETMSLREEAIRLRFEKLIAEYRTRLSSGREVA